MRRAAAICACSTLTGARFIPEVRPMSSRELTPLAALRRWRLRSTLACPLGPANRLWHLSPLDLTSCAPNVETLSQFGGETKKPGRAIAGWLGVRPRSCAPRGEHLGGASFRAKARWLEASLTSSSRQFGGEKRRRSDHRSSGQGKSMIHSHTPRPSSPRGSGSFTPAFRDVLRHNVMPCHPNDRLTD